MRKYHWRYNLTTRSFHVSPPVRGQTDFSLETVLDNPEVFKAYGLDDLDAVTRVNGHVPPTPVEYVPANAWMMIPPPEMSTKQAVLLIIVFIIAAAWVGVLL